MKTIQEIKDEVAKMDGYDSWDDYLHDIQYCDSDSSRFSSIQRALEDLDSSISIIANIYAEQAIDEAANKIAPTNKLMAIGGVGSQAVREFYKEIILNLKNELK